MKKRLTLTINADTRKWLEDKAEENEMSLSATTERYLNILKLADENPEKLQRLSRIQQNIKDGREFSQSSKLMDNQDD